MNRKVGTFLLTFFCFLMWLYFALYHSSIDNWWTVNEIKQTSLDTTQIGVSIVKVLIGTVLFTFSGIIIYLLIRNRE
ncbi:hypothetical protein MHH81_10935 [Psychrobacillus sp. FSL H8-0484]|uniref:hypothetical protein n=1 Tax=Psychrobacillus sp. FSL H8-0484 TaxID=2921390 RepID=UPI0030F5D862